ncbi:MAG TPA: FCD domain-containing protein, partial [Geminicoccaceae bacterium]|nr:FCD domain-containing protein [Geminicoccaceae bacterium]
SEKRPSRRQAAAGWSRQSSGRQATGVKSRCAIHAGRLAEAHAILERGRAAVAAGDKTAMAEADLAFHGLINDLAGNPVIVEIARQQWSHIRRAIDVVLDDARLHARVWDEHAAIVGAIAEGNAARAERLARAHARRAGDETWQRLTTEPDPPGRAEAAA